MVKRYAILAAAVLTVFLCIPRASFAAKTILIGTTSINLPDMKGYTLHVDPASPMFSKVTGCMAICGAPDRVSAMYLSDIYDTGKKIENCMEVDFLSIMDNRVEVAPGVDYSAMLDNIMTRTNSAEAKRNMIAGLERCTKAQSDHAGGIFKFTSASLVNSLRGDNYVVFILKDQIEKRVGDEWKTIVSYDAMANVIVRGRILTVNASDTHRQTTPEAAREIILHLINGLNDANK